MLTWEIDWSDADTDAKAGGGKNALWEESWDDDDTSDDFSAQVRWAFGDLYFAIQQC